MVFRLSEYLPRIPTLDLFGAHGIATSLSAEDLSRARESVARVAELYVEKSRAAEVQVANLIEICRTRIGKKAAPA